MDRTLQFAVVREDPRLELEVIERHGCRRALVAASGGCTALVLAGRVHGLHVDAIDPNPAQLEHVRRKRAALEASSDSERARAFNVGTAAPDGLSECGNFEALFRGLRSFLFDFVAPREEVERFFGVADGAAPDPRDWFASRFWPVAFELFLSDALLLAMFGPDAVQHAEPGSYPGYFRSAFERGLTDSGARDNPFLHHLLLGHYVDREGARPALLEQPIPSVDDRLGLLEGTFQSVADFGAYDLIDLSNVLDWTAPDEAERLLRRIADEQAPGGVVLWRQLNNARNHERAISKTYTFDAVGQRELIARDRSLFYSSVHVGVHDR